MHLSVSRLRVWFALGALFVCALVAGAYLKGRWKRTDVFKHIPEKIGIEIQQSAQGFTISKSEGGRTIFKVQASKAVQYKEGGRAALHDVNIIVYGRDSTRFDQIYGSDFEFDPKSGVVAAKGDVQIDLEANPQGLASPDQAMPKEQRDPVHLKTSGLVFEQKTGNAHTAEKVEFSIPQARGSAVGVSYVAQNTMLTLQSQVDLELSGGSAIRVKAVRATLAKDPHTIVLYQARIESEGQRSVAEKATMFLRPDNTIEKVLAEGGVTWETGKNDPARASAQELELFLANNGNLLRTAKLTGNVQVATSGPHPAHASSRSAVLAFTGKNILNTVHVEGDVKLLQRNQAAAGAQNVELTAPAMDFTVAKGRFLRTAVTLGPPQITARPAAGPGPQTLLTAARFAARFDDHGQLASLVGAPQARIVATGPGQSERTSTSDTLMATFLPGKGAQTIVQQGHVAYVDGDRRAWGDRASYTLANQVLTLTGSPRVVDSGMTTTADAMRLDRATGDALAEGNVKSTYSDLKPKPGGALLASSSPIHVTARTMVAHKTPAVAQYTGDARLWQEANVVEAAALEFDRDKRSVTAHGSARRPVSTVMTQANATGKVTPITITSADLSYADTERKARFEGNVVARGADITLTARQMDVFLRTNQTPEGGRRPSTPGQIEQIVAQGDVVVAQMDRKATGNRLTYTTADDKFVMTGNSPSIFDAEHGKITGVSLTFFRADDRVLVEGNDSAPTVTHTQVAR